MFFPKQKNSYACLPPLSAASFTYCAKFPQPSVAMPRNIEDEIASSPCVSAVLLLGK
jgi:hypothetical protein